MRLSPGAQLCEQQIRACRALPRGRRTVGRKRLARLLGVGVRQVSRYLRELVRAGIVAVRAPRKERTGDRWRSVGFNTYTLLVSDGPIRRSRMKSRGDTSVTPPLAGLGVAARRGPKGPYVGPLLTPAEGAAAFLAAMASP